MKVDVRGEVCPYPELRAIEAMKRALPDEVVEVFTDHAPALETIPVQAERLGFTVNIDKMESAEWRITLARTIQMLSADSPTNKKRVTIILHSGAYDRASYALSLAMTALAMEAEVYMFLTYGGLKRFTKGCLENLEEETDSKMTNVISRGLKTGLIKPLEEQLVNARKLGLKLYACPGTMAQMNIVRSELSQEVDEVMGLAIFLNLALKAAINWYI
ncbi:MAG: DsrE/DsrF/DrsH-like family protein [Dehalococcoidales bacterium]|jgi:peroxiredoxin family protein/TusA-related sulfurtransferase|nr:DsrE/DsrF/DrsH-like family protein [Dehalococcoidales bacterium]